MPLHPWEPYLVDLFQAVRFGPHDACSFAGRRVEASEPDRGGGEAEEFVPAGEAAAETRTERLFETLTRTLYLQCFVRRFAGTWWERPAVDSGNGGPDESMVALLSDANQSRSGWDPGWEICHVGPHGDVQVRQGDRYRTVPPGHYAHPGGPGRWPRNGDSVRLQVVRESVNLQPGFYFAFGETLSDQFDQADCVRFYFDVGPDGAPPLVKRLTSSLNRFQVPFELKCQQSRENYDRIDAIVLFVARCYLDLVGRLALQAARQSGPALGDHVPLFTRKIHAGVGVADDPGGGRSFGEDRCRLLATALLDVRDAGQTDPDAFLAAVDRRFLWKGLSLKRPYLNPNRSDPFDDACWLEDV